MPVVVVVCLLQKANLFTILMPMLAQRYPKNNKINMMKEVIIDSGNLWRKKETLKKIKVDKINWEAFYIDEESNEKWIEEYPFSEMQEGGQPQLRLISEFPWEGSENI